MDEQKFLEFQRLYLKKKNGQFLTRDEIESLKKFLITLSLNEEKNLISKTASSVNESEDNIQTFIEQDLKRY